MEWAFYENPHHFIEKKSFIFGMAMAQRGEIRAKLV